MTSRVLLYAYVAATVAGAIAFGAYLWHGTQAAPGIWEFASLVLIGFLLGQSSTRLKVSATGSTSFVVHIAAGIIFGGFWGGLVAASSSALVLLATGSEPLKFIFNVAQRALSVMLGMLVYQLLGGGMPPAYLHMSGPINPGPLQLDLLLFFVYSAAYFAVNSTFVSTAVALSTGRRFRDVWTVNAKGVFGYDIGASAIALAIAYIYAKSEDMWQLGSLGVLGVVIPILVVRHIYGLYYQLQESGQELLQLMVKAIEARDPYTSGHSLRVSQLSRALALELGLSAREVEHIETAALLHDVGKIHEEFAPLLRKEGRLTEEETALMQTHSTKSAELVGIISKFRGFIQDSVRHHHERWDGNGYPAGLAADAIPLGSRIILISDTIDAMTTDRPYRKRLPVDVVMAELQKCKGTQFDPDLVDLVITSVAIRRFIADPMPASPIAQDGLSRSKRVSWPGGALWKAKRG